MRKYRICFGILDFDSLGSKADLEVKRDKAKLLKEGHFSKGCLWMSEFVDKNRSYVNI